MVNTNLYENTAQLLGLSFASSIFIGISLFFYALFTDYIYYPLNQAVILLESSNLLGSWVGTFMETMQDDVLVLIPNLVDLLWVILFIFFVFAFLQSAYKTKREGYMSVLGFLTFGTMAILFVMTIFVTLSTWFQTEFVAKAIPTLAYATPFFSLYLENIGLVNTVILCLAIILNFVDLELSKFNFRKQGDTQVNELT